MAGRASMTRARAYVSQDLLEVSVMLTFVTPKPVSTTQHAMTANVGVQKDLRGGKSITWHGRSLKKISCNILYCKSYFFCLCF